MNITVKINGKFRDFYFDNFSELTFSKLLFTKVMSNRDQKTGELFPIPFEKDRINFINSIFAKDRHKFIHLEIREVGGVEYYIVKPKERYDLKWLYQNPQMNKGGQKVSNTTGIKNKKKGKNAKNKFEPSLTKLSQKKFKQKLKDSQAINWYMMSKEDRVKVAGGPSNKKKRDSQRKMILDSRPEMRWITVCQVVLGQVSADNYVCLYTRRWIERNPVVPVEL